ncbi:phospholipase-like protein, partial [Tanacetum coccineum]
MNCFQVECLDDDTEIVPLTYHLGDDIEIQFGRDEFCLVTGLRFGVDYSSLYSEGLIPFRRRVFDSSKDGHPITAKMLEDKIKRKQFFTINDKDAVSLCLLSILELVLLGQELRHNVSEWCLRLVNDRNSVLEITDDDENESCYKNEPDFTKPGSSFAFESYNKNEDEKNVCFDTVKENQQPVYHKWKKFMSFKPDIPETPLYKSKPIISKHYNKDSEVSIGNTFDNREALDLGVRLKALEEGYQFLSIRHIRI